ncbi:hypothetical protein HDF23_005301 [Mucilaginibacter lappiensis]|uniref:Uracil-DNA glycosylase-like domain-containing protein n=1 Tax=Mucilaginibacter lappiensis TaxID=354630 RepID=A0ABR6PRW5_9SPHI|nr:uracil-DNA glycosylase family protein [Mucilaginibacter lappiensis]MBB6112526.1 hypothetical protein [Mucilaginibacter lappiensis]
MKEGIVKAYQHSFLMSDELFDSPYDFFKDCADDLEAHVNYLTPYILRENIKPQTDDGKFNLNYLSVDYCLGVDLPIYVSKEGNTKRAFIIAEDPLRNPNDERIKVSQEHTLLSTPFATHLDACRKQLKEYWDFHDALLNNQFNVYITDINKIWLKRNNVNKERIPGDLAINFKRTLQAEIELINPDIIIVYGKKSAMAYDDLNIPFNGVLKAFPHPSKSANGTWKKLFQITYPGIEKSCTAQNKVAYMIEQTLISA